MLNPQSISNLTLIYRRYLWIQLSSVPQAPREGANATLDQDLWRGSWGLIAASGAPF